MNILYNIKHLPRKIKTRLKYGITCCKAYGLHYYWAKQLRREIKGYKDYAGKHVDLTADGFDKDIDKIIRAFELIEKDDMTMESMEADRKEIKEGLELFAKRFEHFWY